MTARGGQFVFFDTFCSAMLDDGYNCGKPAVRGLMIMTGDAISTATFVCGDHRPALDTVESDVTSGIEGAK